MKVAFFDTKPYDVEWFNRVNEAYGFSIKYFESKLNGDTAVLAAGSEVVVAFVNDTLDRAVMDILDKGGTRLIAMRCAGTNNVDFQAAYGRIHVVRVPNYSPYAVAEHAAALLLTLNRKTHRAFLRTRDNNFAIQGLMGMDLHGKTMGVIGTGKIGLALVSIAKGLGMEVLAYDLYPNPDAGVTYVELDELLRRSDVISLHCPLTPETRHLINRAAIDKMKPGVILLNTSRGALIDSEALADGLKSLKIGGAGLDVYEEEGDYFFEDLSGQILQDDLLARLISFPNVLLTSHQAFFTREAMEEIAQVTLENIAQFERGDVMPNEVCYRCTERGKDSCKKVQGKRCF